MIYHAKFVDACREYDKMLLPNLKAFGDGIKDVRKS